ncbi:MAG: exodeoxyribonuclease V subunit gamma, partial [Candidatus Omnitrophica bacterium]|nr:exodeoxyribonuclease V subunit gamma [Candidatus Omnitrophota bacterium]
MKFESLPKFSVLIGPAGTGKTRFLLENFTRLLEENQDPLAEDLLYILPTAEHRERITDLILRKERAGFFGTRVTTLSRLMQDVLKTVSADGEGRGFASGAERRLLLAEILREKGGNYFSAVREFPGFVERMAGLVGELKEALVPPGAFRQSVKALVTARPEIREKYVGLLEIYEAYEERTKSLGLRDLGDALLELQNQKSRTVPSRPPRFRHLFLDGFFDFSRAQLEFIRWLKGQSERITLSLTAELSPERKSLFAIPLATLEDLRRLGFEPVDFFEKKNHRSVSGPLSHVERNLFRPEAPLRCDDGALKILEATGTRGEVEMAAREVRRLVRGGALHYSDIAVILRRIGDYAGLLRTVFREFEIPVEIHERERLRATPVARTLTSFFKILQNDWKREDLFNFLKSSHLESDYAEICGLEMRGLDLGIHSGRERWLKEIGGPLFEKISGFQDRFLAARTLEELIRLTEEALSAFGLARIPFTYEENVRRDFASLKRVRSLFDEVRRSLGPGNGRGMSFEIFSRQLLGLMEVDLFSLHERDKNAVQVYDISLARQKEYKVVFLVGLLERVFPSETREDPVLSDEERRTAGLSERLPRQALERYFFYLAVTRARERMIFSYPRFDLEGHEALPSFYVDEVTRLFSAPLPKISYSVSQSLPRLEDVVEERELEAHVIQRLFQRGRWSVERKQERSLALSLYNRLLERPSFQALLPRVLFDPVARIDSEAVRAAFLPKGEVFTPTRLEAYGRCPYRYFAGHLLELEEQEEGIDARQVGILLHQVLEDYWRERVEKKNQELGAAAPAREFVKRRLRELLKEEPLAGERRFRIELKTAQME